MPSAKFVVSSEIGESFRINKIKGMFDCDIDAVSKTFDVNVPIEDMKWNVGLIVGASGTGKTTIAKEVFKDFNFFEGFEWEAQSIIDDFPESNTPKQITEILSKVGFASPPDWLKPFSVLSNGQKMRAELARLILESDKPFIYDEFTSVVDRQVAKIGSAAIQKFIKKEGKQFIAVSCHYDIKEWLEPDWIFDANEMRFHDVRGLLRRPEIKVDIRRASSQEWRLFKQHHYMTSKHNNAAHKYIAEIEGKPVAWCSVLHFPHPKSKNIKKIHRSVVLPDYQGIGLGNKFTNQICKTYKDQGYRVTLTTSAPAFIYSCINSRLWVMTRKPSRTAATSKKGMLKGSTANQRLTASFEYIGDE